MTRWSMEWWLDMLVPVLFGAVLSAEVATALAANVADLATTADYTQALSINIQSIALSANCASELTTEH